MKLSIPSLGDLRRLKSLFSSATGLATAVLVAGKIAGLFTIPWWLVLGPLWMPFVIVLSIILLSSLGDLLIELLELRSEDNTEVDDDDWSPIKQQQED